MDEQRLHEHHPPRRTKRSSVEPIFVADTKEVIIRFDEDSMRLNDFVTCRFALLLRPFGRHLHSRVVTVHKHVETDKWPEFAWLAWALSSPTTFNCI